MKKKNIGSAFDSWLREEVTSTAIKRVLARQVETALCVQSLLFPGGKI